MLGCALGYSCHLPSHRIRSAMKSSSASDQLVCQFEGLLPCAGKRRSLFLTRTSNLFRSFANKAVLNLDC